MNIDTVNFSGSLKDVLISLNEIVLNINYEIIYNSHSDIHILFNGSEELQPFEIKLVEGEYILSQESEDQKLLMIIDKINDALKAKYRYKPISLCPTLKQNCVSTIDVDSRFAIDPISFPEGVDFNYIISTALSNYESEKFTLNHEDDGYLSYSFEVELLGLTFIDNVEFSHDPERQQIHMRSASTSGLYDFGKNRKRLLQVSEIIRETIKSLFH